MKLVRANTLNEHRYNEFVRRLSPELTPGDLHGSTLQKVFTSSLCLLGGCSRYRPEPRLGLLHTACLRGGGPDSTHQTG
nr:hypothetical protein BgiMline_007936 [Biomphalaria glabrata]